jgi:hypothetical protein
MFKRATIEGETLPGPKKLTLAGAMDAGGVAVMLRQVAAVEQGKGAVGAGKPPSRCASKML